MVMLVSEFYHQIIYELGLGTYKHMLFISWSTLQVLAMVSGT